MIEPAEAALTPRSSVLGDLRAITADLVEYRELLFELTLRDIRIRYKQAVMGVLWAILTPLVLLLSGWILRVAFGRLTGQAPNDIAMAGLAVKSLGWAFFVGALGFGTASITANLALVTKTYFPREILPLASVLTQLVDAGIGILALVLALPFFNVHLSTALLWVIPLVCMLVMITTGAVLLGSCANVFFRDARHLVQLVLSFGIFFTPVFFDLDSFGPVGVRIAMLNPLAPVLEGLRLAVVHGHDLLQPLTSAHGDYVVWAPWYLGYAGLWAVILLGASAVIFHRSEFVFAEYV
ncbi:MAG TPA: ABC transporter permease [Gemmatimonadales bacterium]|nr:ABC transporter permease [Gemmatimonadales bacterium]